MTIEQTDPAPVQHTWPRDHPVVIALTGFFAGLAYVCLVPAAYVALTRWVFSQDTSDDLFPFVIVAVLAPLALLVPERTRWFAKHVALGMVVTAVIVLGVSAMVLWVVMGREG